MGKPVILLNKQSTLGYNHYIPQEIYCQKMVHAIWQIDHLTTFRCETIIPKGIVEVIFNFSSGDPISAQAGESFFKLPACFISGFSTRAIQVRLPVKQVFFGVLFQPLAVRKIFGHPAAVFADTTIDLSLINPDFNSLWQQLAEEDDFNKRVTVFTKWLQGRRFERDPREEQINQFLYNGDPQLLSVRELAGSVCYSSRQLSRKLLEATAMNTESILLYKKYLQAVQLIHQSQLALTAIAYNSGFADQSHFIKTFKTFTGITPGEYRNNKSMIKGHLYKDVR